MTPLTAAEIPYAKNIATRKGALRLGISPDNNAMAHPKKTAMPVLQTVHINVILREFKKLGSLNNLK